MCFIVLILSWSPEGSHLVTSGGVNQKTYVAPIFSRGVWDAHKDFVGPRKPVISVVCDQNQEILILIFNVIYSYFFFIFSDLIKDYLRLQIQVVRSYLLLD
jgi:hypothetical protein